MSITIVPTGNLWAATRPAPPVTFFEPLPLTRAREDELRKQRVVQLAADADAAKQQAAAAAAEEKAKEAAAAKEDAGPEAAKPADAKAAANAKEAKEVIKKIDPLARARKEREEAENAQVLQYVQMLTPSLWKELNFIRQTCELPPAVRPKIKAAGDEALKQAAREVALPQRAGARVQRKTQAGATVIIREALTKSLKDLLPDAEFEKFNQEATQRAAHRKEAAILSAVSRMDALLCLNSNQRDQIAESITTAWQPEWEGWLQLHQYGPQYYPQIPDQQVVAHLNEEQKTVWRGVSKISVNVWGGGDGNVHDVQWWEGKAADAAGEAARPAAVDVQEIREIP